MDNKQNQGLMKLVKTVHDFTLRDDLEKQRRSQVAIGKMIPLFSIATVVAFTPEA